MALNLVVTGAEALCVSGLDPSARPTAAQIRAAVRDTLQRHGGADGCAEEMAEQYGEHPDLLTRRMTWAHDTMRYLARTA